MPKLLIVVPAYNEAENIRRTIHDIERLGSDCDYIIINDGSSDETMNICREDGLNVIDLPINLGLSAAFRTGMKYAKAKDFDYAIQLDGDGQHRCDYVPNMLSYAEKKNIDILIGSRYKNIRKNNSLRQIGGRIISLCILLTTGKKIADPTSGMRLYNKKMIDLFASDCNLYPEPDTIAYLIRSGAKVEEYPVEMNKRMSGTSYLSPLKSIKYMMNTCVLIILMQWFRRKKVMK